MSSDEHQPEWERRLTSGEVIPSDIAPWCSEIGQEHVWSEWEIGPYFPREERFCSKCGGMETQEIRADE